MFKANRKIQNQLLATANKLGELATVEAGDKPFKVAKQGTVYKQYMAAVAAYYKACR